MVRSRKVFINVRCLNVPNACWGIIYIFGLFDIEKHCSSSEAKSVIFANVGNVCFGEN